MIDWLIDWEEEDTIDWFERKQLLLHLFWFLVFYLHLDFCHKTLLNIFFVNPFRSFFVVDFISKIEFDSQVPTRTVWQEYIFTPSCVKGNQTDAPINLIQDNGQVDE